MPDQRQAPLHESTLRPAPIRVKPRPSRYGQPRVVTEQAELAASTDDRARAERVPVIPETTG